MRKNAIRLKAMLRMAGIAVLTAIIVFTAIGCPEDPGDPGNTAETPAAPETFDDITASQLAAKIKIGWNLGNTLDAHKGDSSSFPSDIAGMEKAWNNPVTTKAMIDKIKSSGFNAIRIPVTWYKVVDSNYNIRADWMARVVEIVNYAAGNDMYILLNTHHDEHIFKFTNAGKAASLNAFKKIWEQIADTFKNYNEKLIFEGLNEPRTIGAAHEWNGGNAEERANLNEHYQVFVDTVRASGGNNGKRILMVNTYGASANVPEMQALYSKIPTDSANTKNKIIVSIHSYSPFGFAHQYDAPDAVASWSKNNAQDTAGVRYAIDNAYNTFVSKGIPVIIGEFGSRSEKAEASRAEWAEYYVSYARSKGIPCFLWDDGGWFKFFNRSDGTFFPQSYLTALMNGVNNTTPPAAIEPGGGGGGVTGGGITIGSYTWNAFNDVDNNGTSSITISEEPSGTINLSGNVTTAYEYGFAGWEAVPDAAELANLKAAASISFKVKGDDKTYKIVLPASDVNDYCYHFTTFTAGTTEATVTVDISDFEQPTWGAQKSLNRTLIERIQWQTNDGATGEFSLTIKDLTLGS